MCSLYLFSPPTTQPSAANTPLNEVKKTSGGITIVKLNAQTPSLAVHKPFVQTAIDPPATPRSKVMNGSSSHIRPRTPSQTSNGHNAAAHVVTIHTSSMTTSAASSNPEPNMPAGVPPPPPTSPPPPTTSSSATNPTPTPNGSGVGYTRRAKLGDSRSTGRLHSAGNTHRSMTRLNIAGRCLRFIYTRRHHSSCHQSIL